MSKCLEHGYRHVCPTCVILTLRAQRDALREALAEAGCVLEVYATNHSVIDKIDAILEATKEPV